MNQGAYLWCYIPRRSFYSFCVVNTIIYYFYHQKKKTMERVSWFKKQEIWFETSRFGAMTLMMTFLSCFGAVGAMYSIKNQFYFGLILAGVITMASNVAFIAQISPRLCLLFFYIGLIIDALVIVANIWM